MKKIYLLHNRYMDSVSLMVVGAYIDDLDYVHGAECGMGVKQNIDLIVSEGYDVPAGVTPNDLILAIDADTEEDQARAYAEALKALDKQNDDSARVYRSVSELEPGSFDVVQISLPGKYALKEARAAIDKGMDVFMFTADVSLEEEHDLKVYARDHGCLMMGPDAGVGLLGGVAMAAGSIVRSGPVGVIGASGSGSQEVACLIEALGSGVTCILGTGGRDLKKTVGGVSMMADMNRLEADEDTKLICLVSMLADREIMEEVLCKADRLSKPVVAVFLGADEALYQGHRVHGAYNLQQAAVKCVELLGGPMPKIGWTEAEISALASRRAAMFTGEKKYFRGLYTGGTFAEETLMVFRSNAPAVQLHTNRDNSKYAVRLRTHKQSEAHTLLDMGDLDFTAEAPHTVFDPAQRMQRFTQELADPTVGLIAMDIILGPGVAPDPVSCYLPAMRARPDVTFVCAVCGGEGDPQNKRKVQEALRSAGAIVADSNYESAHLCSEICKLLEEKK